MGYFDSDGNYQADETNYDAGGGGSSWGDNSNQGSGNWWSGISQAISNVANQVQQLPPPQPTSDYQPTPTGNDWWNQSAPAPSYDAGGGGSSWGGNQPDYSWTASAQPQDYSWGWDNNQPFTAV